MFHHARFFIVLGFQKVQTIAQVIVLVDQAFVSVADLLNHIRVLLIRLHIDADIDGVGNL